MLERPKWKKFEELVKKVQEDLAPDAVVTIDEKIDGIISGVKRQIDISIRQKIGQYDVLIVMDCKDLKSPVNVKGVEEVIGLVKDVGAHKGAIVSASGFSKAALQRGNKAGLELYRLVDTGDHDWKTIVSIPVLIHLTKLKTYRLRLSGIDPIVLHYDAKIQEYQVYDGSGKELGTVQELLLEAWLKGKIPHDAGEHKDINFLETQAIIKPEQMFSRVNFTITYIVEKAMYFKQLPVAEISGLKNEVSGAVITKSLTTSDIDTWTFEDEWERIESEDDLAAKPLLIIDMIK